MPKRRDRAVASLLLDRPAEDLGYRGFLVVPALEQLLELHPLLFLALLLLGMYATFPVCLSASGRSIGDSLSPVQLAGDLLDRAVVIAVHAEQLGDLVVAVLAEVDPAERIGA
ncbi:hypothetical protein [Amycolatopsis sp. NPDC003861]